MGSVTTVPKGRVTWDGLQDLNRDVLLYMLLLLPPGGPSGTKPALLHPRHVPWARLLTPGACTTAESGPFLRGNAASARHSYD